MKTVEKQRGARVGSDDVASDSASDSSRKQIGARLLVARADETQEQMAVRMGVYKNTYSRWERGEREPSASDLVHLARDGWNINWLLTGEGPERLDALQNTGSAPATTVDLDVMQEAVEGTLEIIQRTGRKPDLPGMARIISLLYAEFLVGPDPERPVAEALARLAAGDPDKTP